MVLATPAVDDTSNWTRRSVFLLHGQATMVFDEPCWMLAVFWVLFQGFSKKKAARRLA